MTVAVSRPSKIEEHYNQNLNVHNHVGQDKDRDVKPLPKYQPNKPTGPKMIWRKRHDYNFIEIVLEKQLCNFVTLNFPYLFGTIAFCIIKESFFAFVRRVITYDLLPKFFCPFEYYTVLVEHKIWLTFGTLPEQRLSCLVEV